MYSKANKTCRRFVAIFNESVPVTPPRHRALMNFKVFKYIGTRKIFKGDVYLSTNTEGINEYSPWLVYNYDNTAESPSANKNLGWAGSVILKILIIIIMVSNKHNYIW